MICTQCHVYKMCSNRTRPDSSECTKLRDDYIMILISVADAANGIQKQLRMLEKIILDRVRWWKGKYE